MDHIREFSKNVVTYDIYTSVQKEVAKHLIDNLAFKPNTILDLGSGTGEVYRQIKWDFKKFVALDYSTKMCEIHPKNRKVDVINADFESFTCKEQLLANAPFDCVISASALQWAKDLKTVFSYMKEMSGHCAVAIFTDKTFADIYNVSKLETFLPSSKHIQESIKPFFDCKIELKTYRLEFENNMELFRYIKKSGVSGGKKRLSVAQTKALIKEYPLSYLEYEVLYLWSK